MFERTIKALVEPKPDNPDEVILLSPAVGLFRPSLPKGAFVTPDLKMGTLNQLQRYSSLVVPIGARGAVLEQLVNDGVNRVQYKTPLLAIGTRTVDLSNDESETRANGLGPGGQAAGDIVVKSPTDGVFYRRPDPQTAPYVEVGDVIEPGAQLGLVEVMKCFNQIRLEGDGLPTRCEVLQIQAEDANEVAFGQVLFVLRSA